MEELTIEKLVEENKFLKEKTPTEELTEDILAIMNVYVAKINGLRKYEKKLTEIV